MGVIKYVAQFIAVVVLGLLAAGLFIQSSQAMAFGNDVAGGVGLVLTLVVVGVVMYLRKGL